MKQRVVTAIFFAAAMLGGVFGGGFTYFLLFAFITAGSTWEMLGLLMTDEDRFRRFRLVAGSLLAVSFFVLFSGKSLGYWELYSFEHVFTLLYIPVFGVTALMELFLGGKHPFRNIGLYQLALAYIALPLILLSQMATFSGACCATGDVSAAYHPFRVFGLLLLIWTNDTMAYFVGSQLGRHKLFERISPKKTWEGTVGGGICTVLIAWGLSFLIDDFSPVQWVVLGAVAAVLGTLGDLVESMLKRSVGVKDSGTLLPGHGGLLDRFDAFIFALPFYWLALVVLKG